MPVGFPEDPRERGEAVVGIATWGCVVTGFGGLVLAAWAMITGQAGLAGIPLAASALAFGLLANAALRR